MAIEGYIDGLTGAFLIGWAHDPARPGDRLELDVQLDGEPVGRCVADVERKNLARRGIGDGRHGFRLRLPAALAPGSDHVVTVRVAGNREVLPLAPNYIADPSGETRQRKLTLRVANGATPAAPAAAKAPDADADVVAVAAKPKAPKPATPKVPKPATPKAPKAATPALKAATPAPKPAAPPKAAAQPAQPAKPERATQALLGRDGWLFPYEPLGSDPVSPDILRERVRTLRARHKALADVGTTYLVATMPGKAAVYPEKLPPGLEPTAGQRPAEQLVAALRDDPQLDVLDLLGVLRDARRHGEVFLRQGRELSWPGAFHVARAIVKELSKRHAGIVPPPVTALGLGELGDALDPLQSLERVALVGADTVPVRPGEQSPDQEAALAAAAHDAMYVPVPAEIAARLGPSAAVLERETGTELPRAAIFHDGCGIRLVPFLAEHFSRTLVDVSDRMPVGVIEREQATIVVQILSDEGSFFA